MKKRVWLLATCLIASVTMTAVPAIKNVWQQRQLADGKTLSLQLRGDEHGCYWLDKQGNCYTEDPTTGLLQKADRHQVVRQAAIVRQKVNQRRQQRRIIAGEEHQPYVGKKKGLIILVNFTDVKFEAEHDRQLYDDAANKKDFTSKYGHQGSVHDYFLDQSNQQFDLTFDVLGPVQLTHERKYYGADGVTTDEQANIDPNAAYMISEACKAVDDQVNYADYDWDNDGIVDQVMVIYPGHGENGLGGADAIWPQESQLTASYIELELDGKTIDTYACTSELTVYQDPEPDGTYSQGLDGIGTLCHEFAHCLGLPDTYDTGDGIWYGMSTWDIMDGGAYNGRAFLPAAFTAYERMYAGWQQPIELDDKDVDVTDMKALTEGGNTYIIYNKAWKDEYYLLENRQPTKWDRGLHGKGLLVTHVDYMPVFWEYNWVNYSDVLSEIEIHPRCHVMPADDSYRGLMEDDVYIGGIDIAGDTYPYGSRDSLTNTSYPRAFFYNQNTDGSDRMNHAITKIRQNEDGTIAFFFRAVDSNTEISDDPYRTGEVFYKETFDRCSGKGGNDGRWGGSGNIGAARFLPDTEGWPEKNMKGAAQCTLFGSKTDSTTIYTPDFAMKGKAYLTFKAAPYTGEDNKLKLGVDVWKGTATLSQTEFELKENEWTECRTAITGIGDMYLSITFTAAQRIFLDEVLIQAPLPISGIEEIDTKPALPVATSVYDLTGRRISNTPRKGLYIKNGKKYLAQ